MVDDSDNARETRYFDKEMARLLKAVRKAADVSAEQLGNRVGLTQNYISRLENGGINNPPFSTMNQLAESISQIEAIKDMKVNLDDFDTPFAFLIRSYLKSQNVNREYLLKTSDEKMSYAVENKEFIPDEWLSLTGRLIAQGRYLKNLTYFAQQVRKCNVEPQKFAVWLGDVYQELVQMNPDATNKINGIYIEIINGEDSVMDELIGVLLYSLGFYISETRCKEAEASPR